MKSKRKITSALLTLAFCGGVVVILFLFAFRTPLPLPEEEGVVIETNAGGGGGGSNEYFDQEFYEEMSADNIGETNEDYITQDVENANYTSGQQNTNTTDKPKVDNRLTNFSWGQGNGTGTGTGSGSGSGTGTGSGTGVGSGDGPGTGPGSGPGYSLKGRGAKNIPTPKYTEDDQGKVVVTIWVDRNGKVTRAEPGAIGTTVSNPSLWTAAKNAALQAKFSTNESAPEIQKGTITYTFIKLN
ncbi:MAG: energy transducer TonB [Bacteroidales bacterium]|jgi:hypothetical protein|nr:energy transducer TonB [Bacteroidales bacterium]